MHHLRTFFTTPKHVVHAEIQPYVQDKKHLSIYFDKVRYDKKSDLIQFSIDFNAETNVKLPDSRAPRANIVGVIEILPLDICCDTPENLDDEFQSKDEVDAPFVVSNVYCYVESLTFQSNADSSDRQLVIEAFEGLEGRIFKQKIANSIAFDCKFRKGEL
jgi:hypothetical protein